MNAQNKSNPKKNESDIIISFEWINPEDHLSLNVNKEKLRESIVLTKFKV